MKRLATLLVAAVMLVSFSGLAFAEEGTPAEKKDAAPVKTEKKVKKAKKDKKGEAAEAKKDDGAAKPAKPAKKKKEMSGC